jgi:hypothetical protein
VAWRAAALFCAALLLVFGAGLVFLGTLRNTPLPENPPANTAPKNEKVLPLDDNETRPPEAAPAALQERRQAEEFRRLLGNDAAFRRNGELGVREWNRFLHDFPDAPQTMRDEASRRVRQYAQPTPTRPATPDRLQQDVERLEF